MKKRKAPTRRGASVTLYDLLNYYPITEARAFKLAQVHRTTWERWKNGESHPPAATLELIRLHALGEPPDPAFGGFRFVGGLFYDDGGRSYTPGDIRALEFYKTKAFQFIDALKFYDFVPKKEHPDEKAPSMNDGPRLRLVK